MKHKLLVVLLSLSILAVSSRSVLAQGSMPPAGSDPAALPKSAVAMPLTGQTHSENPQRAKILSHAPSLMDGGFERGRLMAWMEYSSHGSPLVVDSNYLLISPHSGNWATWLGGDYNDESSINQGIGLSNYLQLWYWIGSKDNCGSDLGYVIVMIDNITPTIIHTWNLCSANDTNGWTRLNLDVRPYHDAWWLTIKVVTNGALNSNLFIDDVSTYATFADVPYDYWSENYVQRLYNAGITGGCGGSPQGYCPESAVTRAQMAIFLERGIHGSSYAPPAVGGSTGFNDVSPTYWAGAWIKQLAADGITGGCGSDIYCPESSVTRAQMSVFLLRSKYGASYSPPGVGGSTGFNDVSPTYWAAAWIKQLVAEGITAGCGTGMYCPETPVTRAQMAVFLVKTFNLP